jgi:lysophospholipase L1-like esterase
MYRRGIVGILLIGVLVGLVSCNDSPTSPMFDRLVYVAMGASDAVGIGAWPLENGYVYKVRDGLRQRANEVNLHNLGVSGKRIAFIEETELPVALSCQPHVVTIWAGPNDVIAGISVEDFETSLDNILAQLRQSTTAIVVLANVPDMTLIPRFLLAPDPDVTSVRIAAYNSAIARKAAAHNVPVVDLFTGGYATDWEYVSFDGFHPNNQGHDKIAQLYLAVIMKYL